MKDKVKIKEIITFVKNGTKIEYHDSPTQEIGKGEWKQVDVKNHNLKQD